MENLFTIETIQSEAAKIMQRCDKDGDGVVGEEEFEQWYLRTSEAMEKYKKSQANRKPATKKLKKEQRTFSK